MIFVSLLGVLRRLDNSRLLNVPDKRCDPWENPCRVGALDRAQEKHQTGTGDKLQGMGITHIGLGSSLGGVYTPQLESTYT